MKNKTPIREDAPVLPTCMITGSTTGIVESKIPTAVGKPADMRTEKKAIVDRVEIEKAAMDAAHARLSYIESRLANSPSKVTDTDTLLYLVVKVLRKGD